MVYNFLDVGEKTYRKIYLHSIKIYVQCIRISVQSIQAKPRDYPSCICAYYIISVRRIVLDGVNLKSSLALTICKI